VEEVVVVVVVVVVVANSIHFNKGKSKSKRCATLDLDSSFFMAGETARQSCGSVCQSPYHWMVDGKT
jgi:hypothetical protein